MNLLATVSELPGRTIDIGGTSVWDPSRFIIWLVVAIVVIAAALVIRFLERRELRHADDEAHDAIWYRDGV